MQLAFLNSKKYATINALKAALAASIAYALGMYLESHFKMTQSYLWIVITVLVVMSTQPNLGGALDKALMRFLGTVIGAMIAIIILLSVPSWLNYYFAIPFVILAVYTAGASSKFSYAGTLSGITLIIILLNQNPSIQVAMYRAVEISLGIGISLMVNRFVFPIRAETRLKESYANTILQIRDFFDILFIERNDNHRKLREGLYGEFAKHLNLIKELKYEKSDKSVREFEKMSLYSRRLYRYMIISYERLESGFSNKSFENINNEVFNGFKQHIIESLEDIARDIKSRKRISYHEIVKYDKHILPLLEDEQHDETFLFSIRMFLDALEKFSKEYNYILHISKH